MEQEGRERSERDTDQAEVQEEARPEATSTDAPAHAAESTTGPSSVPVIPATESQAQVQITMEPKIPLTFLLITGARRSMSFDPETTVGRVKELIWGGWPEGELLDIDFISLSQFFPWLRRYSCLFHPFDFLSQRISLISFCLR